MLPILDQTAPSQWCCSCCMLSSDHNTAGWSLVILPWSVSQHCVHCCMTLENSCACAETDCSKQPQCLYLMTRPSQPPLSLTTSCHDFLFSMMFLEHEQKYYILIHCLINRFNSAGVFWRQLPSQHWPCQLSTLSSSYFAHQPLTKIKGIWLSNWNFLKIFFHVFFFYKIFF